MTSPAKIAKNEGETVVGHLHSVSPVKTSKKNSRYFEATLQTGRQEFNRVLCFSTEKRNAFVQAAQHSPAVKLTGARKTVSKYWFGFPACIEMDWAMQCWRDECNV